MSAILEKDQLKDTVDGFKDIEPISEFYGGIIYKQNENNSLYHYGNTSSVSEADHWDKVRLIRDKCINLVKKYTDKY